MESPLDDYPRRQCEKALPGTSQRVREEGSKFLWPPFGPLHEREKNTLAFLPPSVLFEDAQAQHPSSSQSERVLLGSVK